jgi:hypothetical protein
MVADWVGGGGDRVSSAMAAGRPREGDKALLAAASVETSGESLATADMQKKVEVGNLWLLCPLDRDPHYFHRGPHDFDRVVATSERADC